MRLLSAGLIYVAVSTVAAVLLAESVGALNRSVSFAARLLGDGAGGLNWGISLASLIVGATAALATFFLMPPACPRTPVSSTTDDRLSKYRSIWLCLVAFVFAIFAVRSFCWLL